VSRGNKAVRAQSMRGRMAMLGLYVQRGAPWFADLRAELREANIEVIAGNAAQPDVLAAANLGGSRYVIIAIPEAFEAGQIVQQARAANPNSQIIARAHSDAEVEHLNSLGADTVIMGEREIARGMIEDFSARQAQRPDQA
jgi:monovalent cation:H+ antiporter-2, CPA2 family